MSHAETLDKWKGYLTGKTSVDNGQENTFDSRQPSTGYFQKRIKDILAFQQSHPDDIQSQRLLINTLLGEVKQRIHFINGELKAALQMSQESYQSQVELGAVPKDPEAWRRESVLGEDAFQQVRSPELVHEKAELKRIINQIVEDDIFRIKTLRNWQEGGDVYGDVQQLSPEFNAIWQQVSRIMAEADQGIASKDQQIQVLNQLGERIHARLGQIPAEMQSVKTELNTLTITAQLQQRTPAENELAPFQNRLKSLQQEQQILTFWMNAIDKNDIAAIRKYLADEAKKTAVLKAAEAARIKAKEDAAAAKAAADAAAEKERMVSDDYILATNFILDVRKNVAGMADFLNEDVLGFDLDPTDPEATLKLKRFLKELDNHPDIKARVFTQITTALLLITQGILLKQSDTNWKVSLPASNWSTSSAFMTIEGDRHPDADKSYDGLMKRMPPELAPMFTFFRSKYIALTVTHDYGAVIRKTFQGKKAPDTALIDAVSQQANEMATDYILAGIFSQGETARVPEQRDAVWVMGDLTRLSMGLWERAIRKVAVDNQNGKKKELTRTIPYSIQSPDQLFIEIRELVARQWKKVDYDRLSPDQKENFYARLSIDDQAIVEMSVRQGFIYHSILLNEADADHSAIEQTLSQELNAWYYFHGGKTIGDAGANKKFAPDTETQHRYAVTVGEFSKGIITLPKEAVEEVTWDKYFETMTSIHGKEKSLSNVKECLQAVGLFTYDEMRNADGTLRTAELSQKVMAFRIKPEYRILGDSDNTADILLVDRRNVKLFDSKFGPTYAITLSLNDILARSRVVESCVLPSGEVMPVIHFDSVPQAVTDNWRKYVDSSTMWQKMAVVNEETPLRNLERVKVEVRRFRGNLSSQASLKLKTMTHGLRGRIFTTTGHLQPSILSIEEDDDWASLSDAERAEREREQKTQHAEYIALMDQVRDMLYVRPSEIGQTEYKETLALATFFEPAIHYLVAGATASKPSLILEPDESRRAYDLDQEFPEIRRSGAKDYVNLDVLYSMFRDISEGMKAGELPLYFPPLLNHWIEVLEEITYARSISSRKAWEMYTRGRLKTELPRSIPDEGALQNEIEDQIGAAEMGIRLELLFLAINLYLNRYMYEELHGSTNLDLYRYENIETVSGAPVLTPDKLRMAEEIFTHYVADVMKTNKYTKSVGGSTRRMDILSEHYSEPIVRRRILEIMERLGLYGSLEATIVAMKWCDDPKGLYSLKGAATLDELSAEGQRVVSQAEKLTHQ